MRNLFELLVPKSIKKAVKRIVMCFIDRNKIVIVSFPDKVIREFNFPQTAVTDADVLNKEEYRSAVFEWAKEANPRVSDIIFVVSEHMIFAKDFHPDRRMKAPSQEAISSFIEVVPFQRIYTSKTTTKDSGTRVAVTNRDIVSVVVRAFEAIGLNSVGVFPELSVLSDAAESTNTQNFMDQAKKHVDILTMHAYAQSAFNTNPERSQKALTQMSVGEAAQQPINPAVAVAIVLVMVGASAYFVYWRFDQVRSAEIEATRKRIELLAAQQSNAEPKATSNELTKVSAQKEDGQASQSDGVEATKAPINKTRIQLVYADESRRAYDLIRSSIVATYGYEVVGEVLSSTPPESNIQVSDKTPDLAAQNIKRILSSAGIAFKESTGAVTAGFDMVITLGKIQPEAERPTQGAKE